jgi:hypothetical protein
MNFVKKEPKPEIKTWPFSLLVEGACFIDPKTNGFWMKTDQNLIMSTSLGTAVLLSKGNEMSSVGHIYSFMLDYPVIPILITEVQYHEKKL